MSISLNIDLKLNTIHETRGNYASSFFIFKKLSYINKKYERYKSLDYNSRVVLEQLLKAGYSKKDIAVTIGVSYYTILRELKINNMTALTYNAQEAQKRKMKLRLERERKIAENN